MLLHQNTGKIILIPSFMGQDDTSINVRELLAAANALRHLPLGAKVLWFTDNATIVDVVKRTYSPAPTLNDALLYFQTIVSARNLIVTPRHVEGVYNPADRPSRGESPRQDQWLTFLAQCNLPDWESDNVTFTRAG